MSVTFSTLRENEVDGSLTISGVPQFIEQAGDALDREVLFGEEDGLWQGDPVFDQVRVHVDLVGADLDGLGSSITGIPWKLAIRAAT